MTREEAVNWLINVTADIGKVEHRALWHYEQALTEIKEMLETMPERERGRWIPVTNGRGGHECDQCHVYAPSWVTGEEHLTNYCPSCGARMEK